MDDNCSDCWKRRVCNLRLMTNFNTMTCFHKETNEARP